jgi:pimeloyl-ACP methyl ester carboxylesterase
MMRNLGILFYLLIASNSWGQNTYLGNFKKSTVKLGEVPFDIFKGTMPVKINRSDSSSGYLALPVHIIKSPSKTTSEPIVWMTGGPGQSNFDFTPPKEFLAGHDFIIIGYRGVDGPIRLTSRKIGKSMLGLHHRMLSTESLDYIGSCMKQYYEKLRKQGIDVNNFTMIDVIDDFEDIRKQLGYSKINLLSGSYGTRVALLYSYRYPDAIKRSLMVGINPPGNFIWWPENTSHIIKTYDSICKKQSSAGDISIEESIRLAITQMPKRWSFFKLDADKIKVASFLLLFDKNNATMVFDAYSKAALKKDYSGLYLMQLMCDYILPKAMVWGDAFSKSLSADFDPAVNYQQSFRPDSTSIGAPVSLLLFGSAINWPMKMIAEEYRKPRISKTETLMIGGNLDISAPAKNATIELLPYLPNGNQVILKDMSHCGNLFWLQWGAFKHMALRFFDEGEVDTTLFKHDPVSFKSRKSFNKMAKWYYPVVLIMSIIK